MEICTNYVHTFPEAARRVVCDFSNNNFGLHHVEALAQWLQQPTTDVTVYASDLSFNSVQCPLWKVLVPLVNKLLQHIQHLDFAGKYLPPILESDKYLKLMHSKVSLSVLHHSQCGDP